MTPAGSDAGGSSFGGPGAMALVGSGVGSPAGGRASLGGAGRLALVGAGDGNPAGCASFDGAGAIDLVGSGVGNAAGGRAFSFTCPSCEAARGDAAGTTGFCGTCVPGANASSSSGPRSQRRSRARNPRTGLTAAGFSEDGGSASALGGPAWAAGFGAAAECTEQSWVQEDHGKT